jgi:hypothetical protein
LRDQRALERAGGHHDPPGVQDTVGRGQDEAGVVGLVQRDNLGGASMSW